jgi:phosphonate transport system substrate-binding protein
MVEIKIIKSARPKAILVFLLCFLITACSSVETATPALPTATASPTTIPQETRTPTQAPTRRPTSTPTLAPLGESSNPIIIGFVISENETLRSEAADEIAFLIQNDTDLTVESRIFEDYAGLTEAIDEESVHLFWLQPLAYIHLNWQEQAQVMLVANHLGVYAYGVRFMAHSDRGFSVNYDPDTDTSPGEPIPTLQQFSGTRPCFLSPTSLTGYYVPMGLLANASTPTQDPVFVYDYSGIIRALYIQGICDFGVGYALTGDPRTAADLVTDFPNLQNIVITVWQSQNIIPNLNLSASPTVPVHLRFRIQESFQDLAQEPGNLTSLSTALDYDVSGFKPVTDAFYNPLRDMIIPLNLDLEQVTQQTLNP